MSDDVDRWFSDAEYGADWQDMDLILADLEFLPRLKTYLDEPSAPEFKKIDAISALLELLEHECPRDSGADSGRLAEELRATIRQHSDVATSALSMLGPVKEVVLRSILGLPVPADFPQWIIDRAREEGA
jgi:hypothetical protein